jgi:hypothetical protein
LRAGAKAIAADTIGNDDCAVPEDEMNDNGIRRCFLFSSLAFTLLGCLISGLSMALPAWQVVDLSEFSATHEHGIFYDCVRSEVTPLDFVRNGRDAYSSKRCFYKFDSSATRTLRMAIEDGDAAAREMLFHRFLPQHKAVIFFFIFMAIFSGISMIVGACSPCFVPNGVLHVISVTLAMACSMLGDAIFWLASVRVDNRNLHGVVNIYHQRLGYGFFVHCFGSLMLLVAALCSSVSAYLLIRREWRLHGCCNSKSVSKHAYPRDSYCHYPSLSFYGIPDLESHTVQLPVCNDYVVPSTPVNVMTRVERRRTSYDPCAPIVREEDV